MFNNIGKLIYQSIRENYIMDLFDLAVDPNLSREHRDHFMQTYLLLRPFYNPLLSRKF